MTNTLTRSAGGAPASVNAASTNGYVYTANGVAGGASFQPASGGGAATPQPKYYWPPLGGTFNYAEIIQYGTQGTAGSITLYEPGNSTPHVMNATTQGATFTFSGSTFTANSLTYANFACSGWTQSATNSGVWVRVYGTFTSGPANAFVMEFKVPSTILNANTGSQANCTGA